MALPSSPLAPLPPAFTAAQLSQPNRALLSRPQRPLELTTLLTPDPGPDELIVRARAISISPADIDADLDPHAAARPLVPGTDVAGDVLAVGSPQVARFRPGDRVAGVAAGGSFQTHAVVRAHMAARIPLSLSFERAAALPSAAAQALLALFHPRFLALALPGEGLARGPGPRAPPLRLLVWGARGPGAAAIQMACAAGCQVVVVCDGDAAYARRLGATWVFGEGRRGRSEAVEALRRRRCAGAVAAADGGVAGCVEVLARAGAAGLVASVVPGTGLDGWQRGVRVKFVDGGLLMDEPDLGRKVLGEFLPRELALGRYVPAPEPDVVGHGLADVQAAVDKVRAEGAGGKKVVVSL